MWSSIWGQLILCPCLFSVGENFRIVRQFSINSNEALMQPHIRSVASAVIIGKIDCVIIGQRFIIGSQQTVSVTRAESLVTEVWNRAEQ
jgi:hypothetical protein